MVDGRGGIAPALDAERIMSTQLLEHAPPSTATDGQRVPAGCAVGSRLV
jgi:hypothetical protein